MSFTPEDSSIRTSKSLEERIAAASSQVEVAEIMREEAVAQRLVIPDIYDPRVLLPTPLASAAPPLARIVTINGVKHLVQGASEQELLANETAIYRKVFAQPDATDTPTDQPRDPVTGRFQSGSEEADASEAARQADLELRWKRGEISSDVYLAESGALNRALEAEGVDLDVMREASTARYTKSVSDAVEEFRERHPEWIGGEDNKNTLGRLIAESPDLLNADPLEALEAAYAFALENNLLVENPEVTTREKISEANSHSDIRRALGRDPANGGELFGR